MPGHPPMQEVCAAESITCYLERLETKLTRYQHQFERLHEDFQRLPDEVVARLNRQQLDAQHLKDDIFCQSRSSPVDKGPVDVDFHYEESENFDVLPTHSLMPRRDVYTFSPRIKESTMSSALPKSSRTGNFRSVDVSGVAPQRSNALDISNIVNSRSWHRYVRKTVTHFPLKQHGVPRLSFDLVSMIFLLYDAISVPYFVAWDTEFSAAPFLVMRALSTSFWTFDIFMSFISCKTSKYGIIMDSFHTIITSYLKSWFTLDLSLCTIDWADLVLTLSASNNWDGASAYFRLLRVLKATRMFRIIISLQSGRFGEVHSVIYNHAYHYGLDALLSVTLRITKIFVLILWVNHLGGCLFYMLVQWDLKDYPTASNWKTDLGTLYGVDDYSPESLPQSFLYASSVYWSMTSMTSGASIFMPKTSGESFFSLLFVTFGILVASSLISSLSAMLVEFNMRNSHRNEVLRKLTSFLRQHALNSGISTRVINQITSRMAERHSISAEDIPSLQLLSVELREELWLNIFRPLLSRHDFLRALDYVDDKFMRHVCFEVVMWRGVKPGEVIVTAGSESDHAVFTKYGQLIYQTHGEHADHRRTATEVTVGVWLYEVTLWLTWEALGYAEAAQASEVLLLSHESLWKLLDAFPELLSIVCDYARTLSELVQRERPPLTDLGTLIDYDTIALLMPSETRMALSRPAWMALQQLKTSATDGAGRGMWAKLEEEFRDGTCELGQDYHGGVLRVVWVVAVNMRRFDGRVCVQLGEMKGDEFHISLVRPGTKIKQGEFPMDAITRFVGAHLPFLESVKWDDRQVETELKVSRRYPLATKYVRTIYYAKLALDQSEFLAGIPFDITNAFNPEGHQVGFDQGLSLSEAWELFSIGKQVYAWMPESAFTAVGKIGDSQSQKLKEVIQTFLAQERDNCKLTLLGPY